MKNFDHWKKLHDSDKLEGFGSDKAGLLWLKIKSIVRRELLAAFAKEANLKLTRSALSKRFEGRYEILSKDVSKSLQLLNAFIQKINKTQASNIDTAQLVSELYKLKNFDWGGDYQNSLDKYLVSRYVKALQSYETLLSKFDTEISRAVPGYVLNSWYNHWSSILIEHIFKSHPAVLPAVRLRWQTSFL